MGKGRRSSRPPPPSHADAAGRARAPPGDPPNPSQESRSSNPPVSGGLSSTALAVIFVGIPLGIAATWLPTIAMALSEFMPSLAALWSTAWVVMSAVLALLILVGLAAAGVATFVVAKRAWSPSLLSSAVARGVVVANCDVSPLSPLSRVSTAAYVVDASGSANAGTQGSNNLLAISRHPVRAPIAVRARR